MAAGLESPNQQPPSQRTSEGSEGSEAIWNHSQNQYLKTQSLTYSLTGLTGLTGITTIIFLHLLIINISNAQDRVYS